MIRRNIKILYAFLVFVVIFVGFVLFVRFYTPFQIRILRFVLRNEPVKLSYSGFRGNLFEAIVFIDPEFIYQSEKVFVSFNAETLRVSYNFTNLFRKRYYFRSLYISNFAFSYRKFLEEKKGKRLEISEILKGLPPIAVGRAVFRNGELFLGERFTEFNLDCQMAKEKDKLVLGIIDLSLVSEKRGKIERLSGNIGVLSSGNVFSSFELKLPGSLPIDAEFTLDGLEPLLGRVKIHCDSLSLIQLDSLFFAGGVLKGLCRVDADIVFTGKTIRGSAFVDGDFLGIELGKVSSDFRYSNGLLELKNFNGYAFGGDLRGDIKIYLNKFPIRYEAKAAVKNFDLSVVAGKDFPSRLAGDFVLFGSGTEPENITLDIAYKAYAGELRGFKVDSSFGHIYVSPDSVFFFDQTVAYYRSFSLSIAGRASKAKGFDMAFKAYGTLESLENIVKADLPSGEFTAKGSIKGELDNPYVEAQAVVNGFDESGIKAKTISADLILKALAQKPTFDARISANYVSFKGFSLDSVRVHIVGVVSLFKFDSAFVYLDSSFLVFGGNIEQLKNVFLDYLKGNVFGVPLELERPFSLSFSDGKLEYSDLFISSMGGKIKINQGSFEKEGFLFNGELKGINLSAISSFLKFPYSVEGMLDCEFSFTIDSVGRSVAKAFVIIDESKFKNIQVSRVEGNISILDNDIFVDEIYIKTEFETFLLTGIIYDLGKSLDLFVKAQGDAVSILSSLVEGIDDFRANYDAAIRLKGDKEKLNIAGTFSLKDGTLFLSSLSDPITAVNIYAYGVNDTIKLAQFSAELITSPIRKRDLFSFLKQLFLRKKAIKGEILGNGFLVVNGVKPEFFVSLKIKGLPLKFVERGLFFQLNGDLVLMGPKPTKLTGGLEIESANILSLGVGGAESERLLIPLDLSLELSIPGNFWILTKNIEAELTGLVNLSTYDGLLDITGKLDFKKGKYFGFGNIFKITDGHLMFVGEEGLNPSVDITALTTVAKKDIIVKLSGKLSAPSFSLFSSDTSYSQQDILFLLALSRPLGEDTLDISARLESRTRSFLELYTKTQLENIARQTLGVESFEVTIPSSALENGFKETQISVGKYLTERLYLEYSGQIFSQSLGSEVKVEYRLNKYLTLEGLRVAPAGELRLSIKWGVDF